MKINVAQYLIARMEQLGIKHMFGVAGNYTAPLLNIIHEGKHNINIIRNTNEQVAGFAADGYARLNGPSAVYVTYSVGAFSAINAIAGSYTEKVPVLIINGAPTNKEYSIERNAGLTYAHTTGDMVPDIEMYRNITVAAERITNAEQARYQIDSALTAMITYNRPVYLEITEDVWRKEIEVEGKIKFYKIIIQNLEETEIEVDKPEHGFEIYKKIILNSNLNSGKGAYITKSNMDEALAAVFEKLATNSKIILWAGIELQRSKLQDDFKGLLQTINQNKNKKKYIQYITTPMSKSVLGENDDYFAGCVTLNQKKVNDLVGDDGLIIGFGAWTIGKDNGNQNIRSEQTILAAHDGLWVGAKFFPLIDLKSFMHAFEEAYISKLNPTLSERLKRIIEKLKRKNHSNLQLNNNSLSFKQSLDELEPIQIDLPTTNLFKTASLSDNITYDSFISNIGEFIKDKPVIVDAGFPLIAAQSLKIPNPSHFIAQASWLSIGYSLGGLTGVSEAYPNSRAVCIVGDGAFQETCQAISDQIVLGHNNVIFVLVNGVYGIEQEIVDPTPFISKNEEEIHQYNILPKWDYVKLNESYGGKGIKVFTIGELENALEEVNNNSCNHYLIEVHVPSTDVPKSIAGKIKDGKDRYIGEDEFENPSWPPIGVY